MKITHETFKSHLGHPLSNELVELMKRKERKHYQKKRISEQKRMQRIMKDINSFSSDVHGTLPIDLGNQPHIAGENILHWMWDTEYESLVWTASYSNDSYRFQAIARLVDIDNGFVLKRRPMWYTGSSRRRFRKIIDTQIKDRFDDVVEVHSFENPSDFYLGTPWPSVKIHT